MIHRYSMRAIAPDYLRAGLGLTATWGPIAGMDLPWVANALLGGLGALFALFAWQAWRCHRARFDVTGEGISVSGGARLGWEEVNALALGYFSVRRDGGAGWMELKIRGGGRTLRLDSRIDGFDDIVRRAVNGARRGRLELDQATLANLGALGIGGGGATEVDPR